MFVSENINNVHTNRIRETASSSWGGVKGGGGGGVSWGELREHAEIRAKRYTSLVVEKDSQPD